MYVRYATVIYSLMCVSHMVAAAWEGSPSPYRWMNNSPSRDTKIGLGIGIKVPQSTLDGQDALKTKLGDASCQFYRTSLSQVCLLYLGTIKKSQFECAQNAFKNICNTCVADVCGACMPHIELSSQRQCIQSITMQPVFGELVATFIAQAHASGVAGIHVQEVGMNIVLGTVARTRQTGAPLEAAALMALVQEIVLPETIFTAKNLCLLDLPDPDASDR